VSATETRQSTSEVSKDWKHVIGPRVVAFRSLTDRFEWGRLNRHIDASGKVMSEWWVATGEVMS
jgi:hypothetical protein